MNKLRNHIDNIKSGLKAFFKRPVKIVIMLIAVISLIGFSSSKYESRLVEDVQIELLDTEDNFFLNDVDVFNLMTLDGSDWLLGREIGDIELKKLEKRLERNPYISRSEIYSDLKGVVRVKTWLKRPIARIIPERGAQAYLCEDRSLMPMSNRYSSRVMLLRGEGTDFIKVQDSMDTDFSKSLFAFIMEINKNPFLKAQIAEIEIAEDKELVIFPQVTKQFIEFGELENVNDKIEKINIFYKDILPFKGWNSYERVSLKYKNQIVCE